ALRTEGRRLRVAAFGELRRGQSQLLRHPRRTFLLLLQLPAFLPLALSRDLRKCRPTLLCRHPIPPFRSTIDPKGMPVAWRGQVGRPGREARPTHPDRGTPLLGQDDVRRLHALRALLGRVLDLRTLRQRLETAAADARVMHKQVLTTLVRSDEPIT